LFGAHKEKTRVRIEGRRVSRDVAFFGGRHLEKKKEGSFFRDIIVDAKDGRNERGFALFERIRARGNARGSTRAVW
jgi:hypothetical protein